MEGGRWEGWLLQRLLESVFVDRGKRKEKKREKGEGDRNPWKICTLRLSPIGGEKEKGGVRKQGPKGGGERWRGKGKQAMSRILLAITDNSLSTRISEVKKRRNLRRKLSKGRRGMMSGCISFISKGGRGGGKEHPQKKIITREEKGKDRSAAFVNSPMPSALTV